MANIEVIRSVNFKPYHHNVLRFVHPRLGRQFDLFLWIIVGGTPAISFMDWGETQRYPQIHTDNQAEIEDLLSILPEGEETVYKYIEEHWARHRRYLTRKRMLSRFFYIHEYRQSAPKNSYSQSDLDNMGFMGIRHEIHNAHISGIQITSAGWSGPLDEKHLRWLEREANFRPEEKYNLAYWFLLKSFLDTLPKGTAIADMTSAQWKHYINLLLLAPKDIERGSREIYRKYFQPHAFEIMFPSHKSHRYGRKHG